MDTSQTDQVQGKSEVSLLDDAALLLLKTQALPTYRKRPLQTARKDAYELYPPRPPILGAATLSVSVYFSVRLSISENCFVVLVMRPVGRRRMPSWSAVSRVQK